VKLSELASTIRSKNAGVDHITFDVIFRDRAAYERTVASGRLSPESVAALYGIEPSRVAFFTTFDPASAIKFTIRRSRPAGTPGEPDPFGSQTYPPLFDVEIP
jgi:Domain of unknown function (DUF4387)